MFRCPPPTVPEQAFAVAEQRMLRATALKYCLDPDTTPPEDILLLDTDKDGGLVVMHEYERCRRWAMLEAGRPK